MTSLVSVDLPDAEDPKNVVRVGWSTDSASLQLGELCVANISCTLQCKGKTKLLLQL